MENVFNEWKDFNNISVKVKIDGKNYNAIIKVNDNNLILEVNMSKILNSSEEINKDYDVIVGNVNYDDKEITFIKCVFNGFSTIQHNLVDVYIVNFRVDRILYGLKLGRLNFKKFLKFKVSYEDIDCFTNDKPYSSNNKLLSYKSNPSNYLIKFLDYDININFISCNNMKDSSLSIKRKTSVKFVSYDKNNIIYVLEQIYKFGSFLMILLKRPILVNKQYLYLDDDIFVELYDCGNFNVDYKKNLELLDHLNHRCLKIEKISNISEIYQNFITNYQKLYPFLELYFNSVRFNSPNLTKFLNATTMLEYFSNEFDKNNALLITKSKKPKKKEAEYVDMIESLIRNVNEIYKYEESEIVKISENIKDARVYYIHYIKDKKSLTHQEQFWYTNFIEDIVILNVYKIIKLDISKYDFLTYLDFYYSKNDLL